MVTGEVPPRAGETEGGVGESAEGGGGGGEEVPRGGVWLPESEFLWTVLLCVWMGAPVKHRELKRERNVCFWDWWRWYLTQPSCHNRSAGYWRKLWLLWLPAPQPCLPPAEGRPLPPRSPRTPSSALWLTGNASRNYWTGSRWMADYTLSDECVHLVSLREGTVG